MALIVRDGVAAERRRRAQPRWEDVYTHRSNRQTTLVPRQLRGGLRGKARGAHAISSQGAVGLAQAVVIVRWVSYAQNCSVPTPAELHVCLVRIGPEARSLVPTCFAPVGLFRQLPLNLKVREENSVRTRAWQISEVDTAFKVTH